MRRRVIVEPTYRELLPKELAAKVDAVADGVLQAGKDNQWARIRRIQDIPPVIAAIEPLLDQLKISLATTPPLFDSECYKTSPSAFDRLITSASVSGFHMIARDPVRKQAWDSADDYTTQEARKSVWPAYQIAYQGHTFDWLYGTPRSGSLLMTAGDAAAWESVADIREEKGIENPFLPLLEIYKQGVVDAEFDRGYRTTFRAHFPLAEVGGWKNQRLLGCWAEGEKELGFAHEWEMAGCPKREQLDEIVSRPIRRRRPRL